MLFVLQESCPRVGGREGHRVHARGELVKVGALYFETDHVLRSVIRITCSIPQLRFINLLPFSEHA